VQTRIAPGEIFSPKSPPELFARGEQTVPDAKKPPSSKKAGRVKRQEVSECQLTGEESPQPTPALRTDVLQSGSAL